MAPESINRTALTLRGRHLLKGVLLLIAAILFLLATPPGLWLCSRAATGLISVFAPYRVDVSGLSGFFPFSFHVDRLNVSDKAGTWLSINSLTVRFPVRDLLRGDFHLKSLAAAELRWERRPIRENRWRIPKIPGIDLYPSADVVSLQRLLLGQPVLGKAVAMTVEGSLQPLPGQHRQSIHLTGERTDGIHGTLDIICEYGGEAPLMRARLEDEEIIPHHLGLDYPATLEINGNGVRKDWRGSVQLKAGGLSLIDGSLQLVGEFPTAITAALDTNIASSHRLAALERFLGPNTRLSLDALLDKSGRLDIFALGACSPHGILQGSGTAFLSERTFNLSFQASHSDLALLTCLDANSGAALPADITASVNGDSSEVLIRAVASSHAQPLFNTETSLLPGPSLQIDGVATAFIAPFTALAPAASIFGESAALAWSAQYAPGGQLTLTSLALDNSALQFHTAGTLAFPSTNTDLRYAGTLIPNSLPPLAVYFPAQPEVPCTGQVSGPLAGPTLSVNIPRVDIAANQLQLRKTSIDLAVRLDQSASAKALRDGAFRLDAQECSFGGEDLAHTSLGCSFDTENMDDFRFRDICLQVPALDARLNADAEYVRNGGQISSRGHFSVEDLTTTALLLPHPFGGVLSADFSVTRDHVTAPVLMATQIEWSNPVGFHERVAPMVGNLLKSTLLVESSGNRLTLREAIVSAEAGTLTASGWHDRSDRTFKLLVKSENTNLAKTLANNGLEAGPASLDLRATLEGTPEDFSVTANARLNDLSWNQLAIRSTKLEIAATHLPNSPRGTLVLSATNGKDGFSLEGKADYQLQAGTLRIKQARFVSGRNRLQADLDFRLDTGDFSSHADFSLPAIDSLSSLLQTGLSGSAQGNFAVSKTKDRLDLKLRAAANQLQTPWGAVASLNADASLADLLHKPKGKALIVAKTATRHGLLVDRLDMALDGDGTSATAKTALSGQYRRSDSEEPLPFSLNTNTAVSIESRSLVLTDTAGLLAGYELSLSGPARIHCLNRQYALDKVAFRAGDGGGELDLHLSDSSLHLAASWKDLPLGLAVLAGQSDVKGGTSGSLLIEGPLQAPAYSLQMTLDAARTRSMEKAPGLTATVKAVHDGHWTAIDANASMDEALVSTFSARVPVDFALSTAVFAVREQDSLTADAVVSASLPSMAAMLGRSDDLPQGTVTGTLRLGGSAATPLVSGELRLENGGYENLRYGAAVKNLHARLVAEGSTVRIAEFSGTDGESGRISATGQLEVSFAKHHPFRAEITLDRMRSLRMETGTAKLSGMLHWSGTLEESGIRGNLTVHEGDFRIPEHGYSATRPQIVYTEKDAAPPPDSEYTAPPVFPAVALDIALNIPNRFFFRAPVLETEWNGDLHIRGILSEVRVEGTLRVTRGYLDIVGQRFMLTDSTVGFTRGDIKTPYLNMTGVCVANDITARIQVTGPPSNAQLTLSSDPPLPQDEILSKLLFRKGVSQVSPLQAIQIARTAAMFSDHLSLPQFLTGNIKLPGIDLFDIRTGDKVDMTVVGVGKYINDKIYVEAEQGTSSESGRVSAQVEVTPRVSVKADVGAKNRGGVGVFWKKDY